MAKKEFLSVVGIITMFGFVAGFVFSFAINFFTQIFFSDADIHLSGAVDAFAGAFFAFLFLRIGDGLTKIYERQIRHYNAMVELEFVLNQNLDQIGRDMLIVENSKNNLAESKSEKIVVENPQDPSPIQIRQELLLRLYGKDIINRVFAYFMVIERVNDDLLTTKRFYRGVIEKSLTARDLRLFLENVPELEKHFSVLEKFLTDLLNRTHNLLAIIRAGLKHKPLFTRIMFLVMRGYTVISEEDIAKEREKLKSEITEMRAKSREEIQKMMDGDVMT